MQCDDGDVGGGGGIYRRYDDSWWLLITTCVEGSAYEGEEKEHLSPLGLSEGQWAFHVSIRHHFLRRPFLQTEKIFHVLNEALEFVKMRCEGIEERFSNNRVIVRPLSWLVCIGPFQPPNKGGTPTTEIQEILSPLSVFSPNKEGTPTTEIRKSFLQFQLFQQTREGLHLLRSGNPFSEPAKPTLEKCCRNQNEEFLSPSGILGLRINSKVEIYWTRGLKWEVSGGQPRCFMSGRLEICLDEAKL